MATSGQESAPRIGIGAWWAVALLGLLYFLSFVDRIVLALLVAPLKSDLHVSDVQLGLLFGPAFGVFYALLGVPVSRLADRGNRRWLVFGGVMLWGLATCLSGLVSSFWMLVVLRIGLAMGEAVLTPAAYSLIGDLFPPHRRSLAASIYAGIGQVGASGGYILGATVIAVVDQAQAAGVETHFSTWRLVLIAVGLPSIAVGLLFAATVREPARIGAGAGIPNLREAFGELRARGRILLGLYLGSGFSQALGYAFAGWGPEVLHRQYTLPIKDAGFMYGVAGLLTAGLGPITAAAVSRWLMRRGRADAIPLTSIGFLTIGATMAAIAPLQASPTAFLICYAVAIMFLIGTASNVSIGTLLLSPPRMRGAFVALQLMSITLLGIGIGPPVSALISSALDPSGAKLGMALTILAPLVCIPALAMFLWARGGKFPELPPRP